MWNDTRYLPGFLLRKPIHWIRTPQKIERCIHPSSLNGFGSRSGNGREGLRLLTVILNVIGRGHAVEFLKASGKIRKTVEANVIGGLRNVIAFLQKQLSRTF